MSLPRWKRGGGRDFVFYHSHPGIDLGGDAQNGAFAATVCGQMQWATMIVQEQGQRWMCASYNPRSTLIVPYSFKDVSVGQQVAEHGDRPKLLFFRQAPLNFPISASPQSSCQSQRYISFKPMGQ